MSGADLSSVWFLAVAVGVAIVGLFGLWLVRRRPRSMQTSMDAFSRELRALAPNQERRRQAAPGSSQVIDLRDQPEPPPVPVSNPRGPLRSRASEPAAQPPRRRRRAAGQG